MEAILLAITGTVTAVFIGLLFTASGNLFGERA